MSMYERLPKVQRSYRSTVAVTWGSGENSSKASARPRNLNQTYNYAFRSLSGVDMDRNPDNVTTPLYNVQHSGSQVA